MNNPLTQENIQSVLDEIYSSAVNGLTKNTPTVKHLASEYLNKYPDKQKAAKAMQKNQIKKCTTSGFITGLGGLITLPVTIPANIASVLYVQLRMIACTAYMAGFDVKSDEVRTFAYACLAGISVNSALKQFGKKFGEKMAVQGIKKIPRAVLTKINQAVGFRLITKFGEKGLVNLGKLTPIVGGFVGGGFDLVETTAIAGRANKMFFEKNFDVGTAVDVDFESDEE